MRELGNEMRLAHTLLQRKAGSRAVMKPRVWGLERSDNEVACRSFSNKTRGMSAQAQPWIS